MSERERVINLPGSEPTKLTVVQTYKATVSCSNCGYRGEAQIQKGKKVEEGQCPECECSPIVNTLSQSGALVMWPPHQPAAVIPNVTLPTSVYPSLADIFREQQQMQEDMEREERMGIRGGQRPFGDSGVRRYLADVESSMSMTAPVTPPTNQPNRNEDSYTASPDTTQRLGRPVDMQQRMDDVSRRILQAGARNGAIISVNDKGEFTTIPITDDGN